MESYLVLAEVVKEILQHVCKKTDLETPHLVLLDGFALPHYLHSLLFKSNVNTLYFSICIKGVPGS